MHRVAVTKAGPRPALRKALIELPRYLVEGLVVFFRHLQPALQPSPRNCKYREDQNIPQEHATHDIVVKEQKKPFWWLSAIPEIERQGRLLRYQDLCEAILRTASEEQREPEPGGGRPYKGPNKIDRDEPVEEGRRRLRTQRMNAMFRMATILARSPLEGQKLLASLVLERRRLQRATPYPADRTWAIQYIVTRGSEAMKLKKTRRQRKLRVRKERDARDEVRKTSRNKYRAKIRQSRRLEAGGIISVAPPQEDSDDSISSKSDGENRRRRKRRRRTGSVVVRAPLATIKEENVDASQDNKTPGEGFPRPTTPVPAPPSPPPGQASLPRELHGQKYGRSENKESRDDETEEDTMSPGSIHEFELQQTKDNIKRAKEQYEAYLRLWDTYRTEGIAERLWKLYYHLFHDLGVDVDEPNFHETGKSIVYQCGPRSFSVFRSSITDDNTVPRFVNSQSKAALEPSGDGPSHGKKIEEFSSPDIPDFDLYSEELPRVPVMITVIDFDRGHAGLEIPILPEPTEDHTKPEASITHLRGGDPVKLFGKLTVEYHQALANTLINRKPNRLWKTRADRLEKLLLHVRHQPLYYSMDLPIFGNSVGEHDALRLLDSTAKILRKILDFADALSIRKDMGQNLVYRLVDHSNDVQSLGDKAFDKLVAYAEKGDIDPLGDFETDDWVRVLEDRARILYDTTNYIETDSLPNDITPLLEPFLDNIKTHVQPIKHHFPDYQPGYDPYAYCPDRPPDKPIKKSRTHLPPRKPKTGRGCFRPSHILRSQVLLDALTVLGGMKGKSRDKLRNFFLDGQSMERERRRLPEEDWEPNFTTCGYETKAGSNARFSIPGRMVESTPFGVFSWRMPRWILKIPEQVVLPPWTEACQGYALMNYRKNRELYERWQFSGWKKYSVSFLDPEAARLLVKELEGNNGNTPPPPPSTPTLLTRWVPTSSLPTHILRNGSLPDGNDDDDGFIEDVEEGTIIPSGATVITRSSSGSTSTIGASPPSMATGADTAAHGTQPQPSMPSGEDPASGRGGDGADDDDSLSEKRVRKQVRFLIPDPEPEETPKETLEGEGMTYHWAPEDLFEFEWDDEHEPGEPTEQELINELRIANLEINDEEEVFGMEGDDEGLAGPHPTGFYDEEGEVRRTSRPEGSGREELSSRDSSPDWLARTAWPGADWTTSAQAQRGIQTLFDAPSNIPENLGGIAQETGNHDTGPRHGEDGDGVE
ncbi:hypothetical protein TWF217_009406 [Orbilia oligospora]|nr:hypothetical protein TWF217_009406 [Orbilia oligospora]